MKNKYLFLILLALIIIGNVILITWYYFKSIKLSKKFCAIIEPEKNYTKIICSTKEFKNYFKNLNCKYIGKLENSSYECIKNYKELLILKNCTDYVISKNYEFYVIDGKKLLVLTINNTKLTLNCKNFVNNNTIVCMFKYKYTLLNYDNIL